ncbi:hypothetical protein DH2020_007347 [Rehmannia glutinosa]|uniref:F-box domain-containing protein n=1 Tax=Rehmannia glutinosa TaxID=99300 RepID=A0ABR0TXY0_REHGL
MSDWADLPDDLLNVILSKVFAKDRQSFGLVCRSWNTVAASSPYRYSPCLMYYHRSMHKWRFYQYNSFFCMDFPELENAEIRCSNYGWLLMSRYDNNLHGEDEWEINEYRPNKNEFLVSRGAPVLHRGLLYFLDVKGNVATFNMSKCDDCKPRLHVKFRCLRRRRLGNKIKEHFLFKIKGEEALFAVFLLHEERKVNMYRLLEPEMKWEPVEDIGDKILYLSHASSFGDTAFLKNMANRIYFSRFHGDSAVFYTLSSGKYHSLDGDYSENNSYGLKRLDFATWITPAPTPEYLAAEMTWCSQGST